MSVQHDFPATRFLCDTIRIKDGRMTKTDLRRKWKAGEYAGVCPKWAKWVMEG